MVADKLAPNPRETASCLSAVMFCFALPILFKGRKKKLESNDLYDVLSEHKAEKLGEKLYRTWEADFKAQSQKGAKKPSMLRVVLKVFGWELIISGIVIAVLELGLRSTIPLLLAGLINEFTLHGNGSSVKAQLYGLGLVSCTVLSVLLFHPFMMHMMHLAMKMRVAVSSAIYRKGLRLSRTALGGTTTGQVVNLVSNDLGRFDRALIHMHFLWLGPLELLIASYFLYAQIGVASFYGIAILLLYVPLQTYLSRLTSALRLRTALRTDRRVRMMNEIIAGIQAIKMYAWEQPFEQMVARARVSEMNVIRKVNYIRGILLSFEITLGRLAIFASLLAYVLAGGQVTAEQAFCVTAFYNVLRRTMSKFFPSGMSQVAELLVSLRRITAFMVREETDVAMLEEEPEEEKAAESKKLLANGNQQQLGSDIGVEIKQLKARWDTQHGEPILDDITMELKSQQLVAVIGPVGAGKSSLIQAILGELPAEAGEVKLNGRCSYASQEPWLFCASVRDNILFGQPLDRQRYRTVVKMCALERDFELLDQGDKTLVGERGVSLSGGQKARISLARAVYRKADVYLLDDPLSAVDTHVGRHLFEKCMREFLRKKLVILVTHQLQFLEHADLIVIMDKGRVLDIGTYEHMLKSGQDFAQLLAQREPEENEEEQQGEADVDSAGAGDANEISNSYSRQNSVESRTSLSTMDSSVNDSLMAGKERPKEVQESRSSDKIGLGMYQKYFTAGCGCLMFLFVIFLCLGTQVMASWGDYFLSYWVKNSSSSSSDIYYFAAINITLIIFAVLRTLLFFNMAMHSSTQLHNAMFRSITRVAMHFFNTNPSGRILNRFAMDMGQVDEVLPLVMLDCIQVFLTLAGIITVLCVTNPWYLINTLAMLLSFYYLRNFYLSTSRDVKRLEAVARSPMYSHFGATLNGLPTIRAMRAQRMLIAEYDDYQDKHSIGYYTFLSTSRAFGYYLDLFCVIYVLIIILNNFVNPPENPGQIGLAITQAMSMTGMVQWGMRQSAELENSMTSVERVIEYRSLKAEGEFNAVGEKKPPASWPPAGQIVADDLSLRYAPDPQAPYILKSLNFVIEPREKVGIVGRTGAGKSSLINALFRLSYNDGSIVIDGRDTEEMGLHDLRSKISIIPQEPVLFSGTIRYNLDPFEQYDDSKLWQALEEVHLKQEISELPMGLLSNVSEGGSNFSVGQRQLICLARAILRENRILVMDEATANVDPQTDALIQTTIRNKFKDCTVLTIAHRLHTIMDLDKVLVLDAGHVVEFGSPYELLTKSESKVFHDMVMQTGKTTFEQLLKIAQQTYEKSQEEKPDDLKQ
ncbi:PREDICTED: probable multidrug resistance-associated protein lethal(2)03659 isoform X2 [Drosophila arizonae]|uniref:Probable multidrug resistance-associated protein lethal(2)03659 isoform X2 n=1 Tax=Drosophila arizonae TaxID=7263 RepID=A0ABM1NV76_DROAR|nr:PREDICTED: probable multidrug resistance-associated protein lethal(2)03659 isoform X2 [Drosophila arizonae]XP_017858862.1 PREDICTED: probable multidrug resistance-associated protein lethal(2)03659 isoform X2 [Drosophila arizonae]XP_017858863.1 PREDICTED: probable multidrug resistance-associated protein lethal(2)03659 isoform X2 [Drosophila arizonae]